MPEFNQPNFPPEFINVQRHLYQAVANESNENELEEAQSPIYTQLESIDDNFRNKVIHSTGGMKIISKVTPTSFVIHVVTVLASLWNVAKTSLGKRLSYTFFMEWVLSVSSQKVSRSTMSTLHHEKAQDEPALLGQICCTFQGVKV